MGHPSPRPVLGRRPVPTTRGGVGLWSGSAGSSGSTYHRRNLDPPIPFSVGVIIPCHRTSYIIMTVPNRTPEPIITCHLTIIIPHLILTSSFIIPPVPLHPSSSSPRTPGRSVRTVHHHGTQYLTYQLTSIIVPGHHPMHCDWRAPVALDPRLRPPIARPIVALLPIALPRARLPP